MFLNKCSYILDVILLVIYPHNCFWICLIITWDALKPALHLNLQKCSSFRNPLNTMASNIFSLLIYMSWFPTIIVKDLLSSITAHEHIFIFFFASSSIDSAKSLLKGIHLQALHMHTFSFVWNYNDTFTNIVILHATYTSVNKSKLFPPEQ